MQEFNQFARGLLQQRGSSGDVSPWPREAGDEATADWVRDRNEHNGRRSDGKLRRAHRLRARHNEDVQGLRNQLSEERVETAKLTTRILKDELDVASAPPAKLAV